MEKYVFLGTSAVCAAMDLVYELGVYNLTIPDDCNAMKRRFWFSYVFGLALMCVVIAGGYRVVSSLSESGWRWTAWFAAIVPVPLLIYGGFLLHGIDTVLTTATGNTASVVLFATLKKSLNHKTKHHGKEEGCGKNEEGRRTAQSEDSV